VIADCKASLASADDNRLDPLSHYKYPDQLGKRNRP
jgi:hypothetical protein